MTRVDGRSKRVKAEAVGLSVVEGVRPAARKMGVPESTIRYWRETPEFAQLRARKKDEVQEEVWAAFQTGLRRIVELIPQTDDLTKVATATGIVYDKFALMSGAATMRTESRDVTGDLPEGEKEALADAIDEWLKEKA